MGRGMPFWGSAIHKILSKYREREEGAIPNLFLNFAEISTSASKITKSTKTTMEE